MLLLRTRPGIGGRYPATPFWRSSSDGCFGGLLAPRPITTPGYDKRADSDLRPRRSQEATRPVARANDCSGFESDTKPHLVRYDSRHALPATKPIVAFNGGAMHEPNLIGGVLRPRSVASANCPKAPYRRGAKYGNRPAPGRCNAQLSPRAIHLPGLRSSLRFRTQTTAICSRLSGQFPFERTP